MDILPWSLFRSLWKIDSGFALSSIEVELYSEVFFFLKKNDNDRLLDSGFSASLA